MTFHLGLLFNSVQCCNLGFPVFRVLIFKIGRIAIITWGGLASLWPGLLLFLMALGKAVSSREWWAAGNGMSLPTLLVWKPWRSVSLVWLALPPAFLSSWFPFHFFFSSHPSSCRLAWRGLFPALSPQEQQRSAQPVLLGSLARALLTAAVSEAERVACQLQNCISDAILVKNHLKMVLCFHSVFFLSLGQRNVLALSCSNLYVNSLLPFLKL